MMSEKEKMWETQGKALRSPAEIFGTSYENAGITDKTLKFKASSAFTKLLADLNITLLVSREYENLLIALNANGSSTIHQTFFHIPHPSGIAINRKKNSVYVAATRNPNQIVEFKITSDKLNRLDKTKPDSKNVLIPFRTKYYPGEYYFHDLAFINNKLYANSVGMNSVLEIDFTKDKHEKPIWWPKCVEQNNVPNRKANYIQLNSIAAGKTLESSFFTASGVSMSSIRPGHLDYPVDKKGVVFGGKTREPVAKGLTRPHSARMHKNKIWVANSGYGEVGYIEKEQFKPVFKLKGWTRGLCFVGDIMFVGVSRVLPRFKAYAPGLNVNSSQSCSIVAFDLRSDKKIGEINFPYGNQIFAIEYMVSDKCSGFPFNTIKENNAESLTFSMALI
jgi:uncharacterized protein (TIGR03032 family)